MSARSIPRYLVVTHLAAILACLAPATLAQSTAPPAAAGGVAPVAQAQSPSPVASPAPATGPLYAVEFKVGPRWVAGKPPQEQDQFREHSANLRKLREQGSLVMGARYGDKGFILLAAETEAAARALIDADPAVQHGTFVYELNEFSVFYGGAVQPRPRPR